MVIATAVLAASLLSFHPGDPPSRMVFPLSTEVQNLCGRFGSLVAFHLLNALGVGAYFLLASLIVLDAQLVRLRAVTHPRLRATGLMLALTGVCTLFAMIMPQLSPGPVIGSGGYLGATGQGVLEAHFANFGGCLLAASAIVVGLWLASDYLLVRMLTWSVVMPLKGMLLAVVLVDQKRARRKREMATATTAGAGADHAENDPAELDKGEADAASGPAVRIAGRETDEEPDGGGATENKGQAGADKTASAHAQAGSKPEHSPLRIRKPKQPSREVLLKEIEAASNQGAAADYELPSLDLLLESEPFCFEEHEEEVRRKANLLEKTFANFGYSVRVVEIQTGPVIAQYEIQLEAGLRLSRITGLADDVAIALKVPSVRIVAPIPGKNTVGVEVPNSERQLVRLRDVMEEAHGRTQSMRIPIFLGKDVSGNAMIVDLATLPHLLIAGRTGTGKSVCLNSIIVSLLMTRRPDEVRTLLIDPKMVELSPYKKIPHLMHPVVTDMRKAEAILAWAVEKMEERYQLLARAGVRHLSVYNQLGEEELRDRMEVEDDEQWAQIPKHMPYIVIVVDELADLMMTAAKEVEQHIIRLAQKSRAVGLHLVLATQKPTVDVITGLIKSNLPARICFEVSSRTDSRVVLDEMGADKLLGDGDMLFLRPGTAGLIRGQGTYLSDDEITSVIDAVATSEPQFVSELVQLETPETLVEGRPLKSRDELYEGAVDVVVREGRGSVSLLQRTLGIGYGRAARLIDFMEEDGVVGPYNGSQAREVLITVEQWEGMRGQAPGEGFAQLPEQSESSTQLSQPTTSIPSPPPPPPRPNKIFIAPAEEEDLDETDATDAPFDDERTVPPITVSKNMDKTIHSAEQEEDPAEDEEEYEDEEDDEQEEGEEDGEYEYEDDAEEDDAEEEDDEEEDDEAA